MPLSNLNEEQHKAATSDIGQNLIIASAGTGKTSTIVARIAHLLRSGIDPSQILLLTFTNKASAEMISRLERYYPKSITTSIISGTFHSVAYKYLKAENNKISIKQPKELKGLLKTIVERRNFSHLMDVTPPYKALFLYDLFCLYENSELIHSFSDWLSKRNQEHNAYLDIYEDIYLEFQDTKKKYNYCDFNDVLIFGRELFKENQNGFYEILVDEFQDTNLLQNSFIEEIPHKSLFCVGDYDQSIYAFNGANINIIASFKDNYPDANIHNLSKNYRSGKNILLLASQVIQNNPRLYPKKLEVMKKSFNENPKLLVYDELYDQYNAISQTILESNTPKDKIAIIFRNNSSADGIEASLRNLGIECKRKGGRSLFDSREVKFILALVSIIANTKDIMSFISIFEFAPGVGASISKEIYEVLEDIGQGDLIQGLLNPVDSNKNFFKKKVQNYQLGLFDDFDDVGSVSRFKGLEFDDKFLSNPILKHPKMNVDGAKFVYKVYKFIKNNHSIKSPSTLLNNVIYSEVFKTIVFSLAKQRATNKDGSVDEDHQQLARERIKRKANLIYELSKNYKNTQNFLNALNLVNSEINEGEGVNLLTVHSSKGLEFEEVYIIDLMDGRFPNTKLASQSGSIEEERRLFYVAVTRAMSKLSLSYAKYDKIKKQTFKPSIFLEEAKIL
ncbi:MAG: ATP-dependent DNA helicase UvrD/PcrA/Rep, epsilon proteobacterial type 1 [uncultured Campylobacterales bacterium]|uniref:DNA 3'-5' helicase n=1 Tax=uncultured Campylobacterales bacterium TaxID=352960 RepID=A0A6S6S5C5_9BACT|nr:MAG: ATP-dependent DNA helicase UvrD/PcrA/Rep, epsilon proteobacterial type 1 [uncultured Campylobacterales bacterium]